MKLLTPDEFFERVGVEVPDSVIRNLEGRDIEVELSRCIEGCHRDRVSGVWWHSPGCPNLERRGQVELLEQGDERDE